jgi:hypothetical protein
MSPPAPIGCFQAPGATSLADRRVHRPIIWEGAAGLRSDTLVRRHEPLAGLEPGPTMPRNAIMKRLRIEGFVILDHLHRYALIHPRPAAWMRAAQLKYRLHIVDGLECAAHALTLLHSGGNDGRSMVRIGAGSIGPGAAAPLLGRVVAPV